MGLSGAGFWLGLFRQWRPGAIPPQSTSANALTCLRVKGAMLRMVFSVSVFKTREPIYCQKIRSFLFVLSDFYRALPSASSSGRSGHFLWLDICIHLLWMWQLSPDPATYCCPHECLSRTNHLLVLELNKTQGPVGFPGSVHPGSSVGGAKVRPETEINQPGFSSPGVRSRLEANLNPCRTPL